MSASKLGLVASLAFVVSGCPGDDGGSSADEDSGDGGGGDLLSCMQRDWSCTLPDGSTAEMNIDGMSIDGSFMMMGVGADVQATFTLDDAVLSVTDTGGSGACPSDQLGVYEASCSADALSFTLMSDDCMGRMNFFGCSWTGS